MNKILFEVLNSLSWFYQLINSKLAIEPSILQGVTMGLITILVSLFIAQLNSNSDFGKLDIWVILDHILEFRKFILITASSLVIPFMWKIPIVDNFNLLFLVLWTSLNLIIINKLLKVYSWIKGDKNEIRLSYLKSVNKEENIKVAFSSIWKVNDIDSDSMQKFLEAFIDKLNDLNKEKKYLIVSNMLQDFENNITNINPSLSYKSIRYLLENMLSLYYEFSLLLEQTNAKNSDSKFPFHMARNSSVNIITDVEKIILKSRQEIFPDIFFLKIEEFINKHLKEVKIIKFLFPKIVKILFENIGTDSFNGLPRSWAITSETVEANNLVSYILFDFFLKWVQEKLDEPIENFNDTQVETMVEKLFPGVELRILSNFLVLLISYKKGYPMDWTVKTKWGFGKISLVSFFYGEDLEKNREELLNKKIEEQRNKTFQLIATLIKKNWVFIPPSPLEILEKYKKELENLKFAQESPEEYARKEYLELVTKVIELLQK